jgi:hypothetical protein
MDMGQGQDERREDGAGLPVPPLSTRPASLGKKQAWMQSDAGKKLITLVAVLYILLYTFGAAFYIFALPYIDIGGTKNHVTIPWPFFAYAVFGFAIQIVLIGIGLWFLWRSPKTS